ncbi:hypothetical protein V8D89_002591 [Ganoderma adspersum]
MQDTGNDLLHLGDLALPEDTALGEHHNPDIVACCTAQCLLADEDRIALSHLAPDEVQEWGLLRITEYRNHNCLLRERYGAEARNAISKNKSHIRAIHIAYNDAAPINRRLPPEVLIEIFSHVHPVVTPRRHVPILGVCSYWRRLLFRTPQFWANILSLPIWKSWDPKYYRSLDLFEVAMARSAPQRLTLSVPSCDSYIADTLASHAIRISSLKVGPTWYHLGCMAQVLEQRMPLLTYLAILHQRSWWRNASTFTLNLPSYPNIQTLEFDDTYFHIPVAPLAYASLRHLKLKHCIVRPPPGTGGSVRAFCTVQNTLGSFPNLETLSLVYSLSDDDPRGNLRALPELESKTIHLPRLRHLELVDIPAYVHLFLSHLIFPATTSLVLEPAYAHDFSRRPPAVPLFPDINPFPTPTAELSLCLYSRSVRSGDEYVARWETLTGDGVRPVRITLPSIQRQWRDHDASLVARFTRELAAALAPAPAPGVASLDVQTYTYFAASEWRRLMLELPGLRSLACSCPWTTKTLLDVLGARSSDSDPGDGFLCTRLAHLSLSWEIPHDTRLGQGGEWDSLRRQGDVNGPGPKRLVASLAEFCDALGACLTKRVGHCEPIRKLEVTLHWEFRRSERSVLEGWQVALVEQRLRHALGHLVGNVVVVAEVS